MHVTRRRALAAVALVAVVAAAVVLRFWWTAEEPFDDVLPPGWAATVHVLAGDGVIGSRDGASNRARFAEPFGVVAGTDGLIYVADGAGGDRIRAVSASGGVATLAGRISGFRDGSGITARFSTPSGLAIDRSGVLYVADTGNHAVRRITPDGYTTTLAGNGASGFRDGPAGEALFNAPVGVAVDSTGRVLVADTYNDRIRAVTPHGTVTTLAGADRGFADGNIADARFDTPSGIAVGADGALFVADTGNGRIRKITADGTVSTVMDAAHGLTRPVGIAVTPAGDLYAADENGRIVELAPDGSVRVVAGATSGYRNGPGIDARFRRPAGVAWIAPGRIVVADAGNALVRLIEADAIAAARPPPAPWIDPQFDVAGFAHRPLLWPLDPQVGPFEVAGTMGEARGEDASRFHSGLDVRAEQGLDVLAVRDGVVQSPLAAADFGTLNESVRIGSLVYVHIRVGRDRQGRVDDQTRFAASRDADGRVVAIRAKRGARFQAGETIGTINAFNHVHLNVGWPGEEHNPLRFNLVRFHDSIPPVIVGGGIRLYGEDGRQITRRIARRLVVSGDVQIVVDAWDQADGNRADRRLGLYELGYEVLTPDGAAAPGFETPRMTLRFDRLSGEPDAPRLVYAPGSGIPFYGGRRTRFFYVVTNTFENGRAAAGAWRTGELTPGDYTLRIVARDASGNAAVANRDLLVTIEAAPR